MKAVKNLVAIVGKYKAQDGTEKNRYQNIGKLFKREDGTFAIKLEVLPIGTDWTGWVSLYEIDDKNQQQQQQQQQPAQQKTAAQQPAPVNVDDDDLPF